MSLATEDGSIRPRKVAVGLSGGVDSSLSAALLLQAGYEVTGVFLECWRGPGCRADEDRKDALTVALQLGIPFQVLDFKQAYKDKVVEYFFAEYAAGRTPNPDVLCNKEIKFGLFYDWVLAQGFDAVATGHYARIGELTEDLELQSVLRLTQSTPVLQRGLDSKKDQSYFLYLLREEQLSHILFPVGSMQKTEVRKKAAELHLPVASKPDSQGICFIGDVDVRGFLRDRLGEKPGEVVDTQGQVIGTHKGLWFYTIGQRHGFEVLGKVRDGHGEWKHVVPPFFVIRKDAASNQLVVGYGAETLRSEFGVEQLHWITLCMQEFFNREKKLECRVRIRHGGSLLSAQLLSTAQSPKVILREAVQGVAAGQSVVFYLGQTCLGGGVISI